MLKANGSDELTEHFNFFYVQALDNGSLFVGPKFSSLEKEEDREDIIKLAHKALKEAFIDVSGIRRDENYGEVSFYINNRLRDALDILHEIDEEF